MAATPIQQLILWAPGILAILFGGIPAVSAWRNQARFHEALTQALAGTKDSQRRGLDSAPAAMRRNSRMMLAGWVTLLIGLLYLMALGLMGRLTP